VSRKAPVVVADAGPLIGLARINRLDLLSRLFEGVLIPKAVEDELRLEDNRPGSRALAAAVSKKWIKAAAADEPPARLLGALDRGEAEAIVLAAKRNARLLIDDRRGRIAARREGVQVFGIGALLIRSKQRRLIRAVAPVLAALQDGGYRLSARLQNEILCLAKET